MELRRFYWDHQTIPTFRRPNSSTTPRICLLNMRQIHFHSCPWTQQNRNWWRYLTKYKERWTESFHGILSWYCSLQVEVGMNNDGDEDQKEGDEWELQKRIELAQWKKWQVWIKIMTILLCVKGPDYRSHFLYHFLRLILWNLVSEDALQIIWNRSDPMSPQEIHPSFSLPVDHRFVVLDVLFFKE